MTGNHSRAQRGFTLIEILVVIGIIAILAAIIFPVLTPVRKKANATTGELNIRQLSYAVLQYMQDNEEEGPRTGYSCLRGDGSDPHMPLGAVNQCGGDEWQDAVAPYVKSKQIFASPADQSQVASTTPGGPFDFKPDDGPFSVLYNDALCHAAPTQGGSPTSAGYADIVNSRKDSDGIPMSGIKSPTDCVMLIEGHGGWDKTSGADPSNIVRTDWTGSTDLHNKWHLEQGLSINHTQFLTSGDYAGDPATIDGIPFLNNGGNVAFLDGHQASKIFCDSYGHPALCRTLPWTLSVDPLQRSAEKDSCNDPLNPTGAGYNTSNWF